MTNKIHSIGTRVFTWLLVLMKILAKSAKLFTLAKPLVVIVSMSISTIAYTFFLGPWFAIGLVAMLFIHEMGHIAAMNIRGYKASAPVFIPFIGAAIFLPEIANRDDEAFIGIGGPILGGLAASVTFGIWFFVEDKESDLASILLMVSYIGFFINVFNLLPIRPLDGGRVTQAVGPWFKYVGIVALGFLSISFREPFILFIWILVMPEITFLSLRLRSIISQTMWISMVVLMALGYSAQSFWVDLADIIIAGILVLVLVNQAKTGIDPAKEDDYRPMLQRSERLGWFIRYAVLTAVLIGLIVFQVQFLHK